MKFIISRTSTWSDEDVKVKGAKLESFPRYHERTCTEEYFNKHFGNSEGLWRSKGTEHKTIDNGKGISRRDGDIKRWTIEIDNLEELFDNGNYSVTFTLLGNLSLCWANTSCLTSGKLPTGDKQCQQRRKYVFTVRNQ